MRILRAGIQIFKPDNNTKKHQNGPKKMRQFLIGQNLKISKTYK